MRYGTSVNNGVQVSKQAEIHTPWTTVVSKRKKINLQAFHNIFNEDFFSYVLDN